MKATYFIVACGGTIQDFSFFVHIISYYDVFVSFACFFFLLVEDYHEYNIDKCLPGN